MAELTEEEWEQLFDSQQVNPVQTAEQELVQRILNVQLQAKIVLELALSKNNPLVYQKLGELWVPKLDDFQRIFKQGSEEAYQKYLELFGDTIPTLSPKNRHDNIYILASNSLLIEQNVLMPNGYRKIIPNLHEEPIWVGWKYVEGKNRSGLAYNGLVWVEDHFVWIPKAWRLF